ncbi:MAG: hypothetical protein IJ563_02040 [Selenomonadaceae bacterium]|nr:hypothetical protein [Selenomonadaceae bacterium]
MNDFKQNFQWSNEQAKDDIALLHSYYSEAAQIQRADKSLDKKGVEYIVTLPNGKPINIDVKRRKVGSSNHWRNRNDPELAIEINSNDHKSGWLFNLDYLTDKVLYIFDKADSDTTFLLDYRKLRIIATKFKDFWIKKFGEKTQRNINAGNYYQSKCLFIPVSELKRAFNSNVILVFN